MLLSLTLVEIGGTTIAVQAAPNYRTLREPGITPRKTIDTLIAPRCVEDGFALLHSDQDFVPFVRLGLRTA